MPRSASATRAPNAKPATCATHATPLLGSVKNCVTNQITSTRGGGQVERKEEQRQHDAQDAARGNQIRYAPITPAIAPDAPTSGETELALNATNASVATMPAAK